MTFSSLTFLVVLLAAFFAKVCMGAALLLPVFGTAYQLISAGLAGHLLYRSRACSGCLVKMA